MSYQASASQFWKSSLYSDVRLQLCTMQHTLSNSEPSPFSDGDELAGQQPVGSLLRSALYRLVSYIAGDEDCKPGLATPRLDATAPAAQRSPAHAGTRTYHLHAVTLACASGHFRMLMPLRSSALASRSTSSGREDGGGSGGDCAPGGSAAAQMLELVEHVEEGELDAMEAVLRHCYTGQLCQEGGDAADLSVEYLLEMMVLANRFDVPLCLTHACDELARRPASAHGVSTINAVLADLTTTWHTLSSFTHVVAAATERLLQLLGNAEEVCDAVHDKVYGTCGSGMDTQLQRLSLPSLLVLLGSDCLRARSENSVLVMADVWLAGQAGAACTKQQRLQVVEVLRLGQLSQTYLFDVLPALPWLGLSRPEYKGLTRFSAAAVGNAPETAGALTTQQGSLQAAGQLDGPAGWYLAARSAVAGAQTFSWDISSAEMAEHLRRNGEAVAERHVLCSSGLFFFNGFSLRLVLGFPRPAPGSLPQPLVAPEQARLCVQVSSAMSSSTAMEGGGVTIACASVDVTVSCWVVQVGREEAGGGGGGGGDGGSRRSRVRVHDFLCSESIYMVLDLPKVRRGQVLDLAGWAAYLVGGKLRFGCTIHACK